MYYEHVMSSVEIALYHTEISQPGIDADDVTESAVTSCIQNLKYHLYKDSTYLPYSDFHNALVLGKKDFAEAVLEGIDEARLELLLSRCVDYSLFGEDDRKDVKVIFSKLHNSTSFVLTLPLSLACSSGNTDLVKSLLRHGLDIMLTDAKGDNIIHDLVRISCKNSKLATDMYSLLISPLSTKEKTAILKQENKDGLNPLDLAAASCCPLMMETIINTCDVYKVIVRLCGINRNVLYDVTSYERPEVRSKHYTFHLLRFLTYYNEQDMLNLHQSGVLTRDPLKTWISKRYRNFHLFLIFHSLYWLVYLAGFFGLISFLTGQHMLPPVWILCVVSVLSAINLITELTHVLLPWWDGRKAYYSRICEGYRNPNKMSGNSRAPYIAFSIVNITISSLHFVAVDIANPDIMKTLGALYVIGIMCAMACLLFFLQVNSRTGHFVAMFGKMAFDTVAFATVYVFVYLAFGISLFVAHMDASHVSTHFNLTAEANHTAAMSDAPDTFTKSLYNSFFLLLGIIIPKSLYFEETSFPLLTMIIYVSAVVISGIILLNLLIGIMSQRVMEITEQKETILVFQRLSLMFFLEDMMNAPFGLISILNRIVNGRLISVHDSFVVDDDTCQVLIPCVQNIIQEGQ